MPEREWRCLLKGPNVDIANTITVIAAFCVHHNCETHGDHFEDNWMEGVNADSVGASATQSCNIQSTDN